MTQNFHIEGICLPANRYWKGHNSRNTYLYITDPNIVARIIVIHIDRCIFSIIVYLFLVQVLAPCTLGSV